MSIDVLDIPLTEVLADETLVVLGPHVRKQLIRAEERLVTKLDYQLMSCLLGGA